MRACVSVDARRPATAAHRRRAAQRQPREPFRGLFGCRRPRPLTPPSRTQDRQDPPLACAGTGCPCLGPAAAHTPVGRVNVSAMSAQAEPDRLARVSLWQAAVLPQPAGFLPQSCRLPLAASPAGAPAPGPSPRPRLRCRLAWAHRRRRPARAGRCTPVSGGARGPRAYAHCAARPAHPHRPRRQSGRGAAAREGPASGTPRQAERG